MKTVIEMAREAGWPDSLVAPVIMAKLAEFAELVRKDYSFTHAQMWLKRFDDAILAEREQIAKIIEDAPALVEFVTNDHGGCLMCGFTPKLAAASIRERGNE